MLRCRLRPLLSLVCLSCVPSKPAEAVAFALPEDAVRACMGHTKTVLRRLKEAKGWYIDG